LPQEVPEMTTQLLDLSALEYLNRNEEILGGGIGATQPNSISALLMHADAKQLLNQFCQKVTRKPKKPTDCEFSVEQCIGGYQATVTLGCTGGLMFSGPVDADIRRAEKTAAEQALIHFSGDPVYGEFVEQLYSLYSPAAPAPVATRSSVHGPLTLALPTGPPAGAQYHPPPRDDQLPAEFVNQNYKLSLNIAVGKVTRTLLVKDGITYENIWTAEGYQSVCRCHNFPSEQFERGWLGIVCAKKKDAETSAAGAALGALLSNPEWHRQCTIQKVNVAARPGGKGGIAMQQMALTGRAVKSFLGIVLAPDVSDGDAIVCGQVEVSPGTTLSSVRVLIRNLGNRNVPIDYMFFTQGITVTREMEGQFLAIESMPQLTIMRDEDVKGARLRRKREAQKEEAEKKELRMEAEKREQQKRDARDARRAVDSRRDDDRRQEERRDRERKRSRSPARRRSRDRR